MRFRSGTHPRRSAPPPRTTLHRPLACARGAVAGALARSVCRRVLTLAGPVPAVTKHFREGKINDHTAEHVYTIASLQ